jgi:hypothetical protein
MANYMGAPRQLLDHKQGEIVFHTPSFVLAEPTAFPIASQSLFTRRTIIPQIAAYTPPTPIKIQAILDSISPGLRLREDKVLLENTAFRVIDATFIRTSDSSAGSEGNKKPPVAVGGVVPKSTRASSKVLDSNLGRDR